MRLIWSARYPPPWQKRGVEVMDLSEEVRAQFKSEAQARRELLEAVGFPNSKLWLSLERLATEEELRQLAEDRAVRREEFNARMGW